MRSAGWPNSPPKAAREAASPGLQESLKAPPFPPPRFARTPFSPPPFPRAALFQRLLSSLARKYPRRRHPPRARSATPGPGARGRATGGKGGARPSARRPSPGPSFFNACSHHWSANIPAGGIRRVPEAPRPAPERKAAPRVARGGARPPTRPPRAPQPAAEVIRASASIFSRARPLSMLSAAISTPSRRLPARPATTSAAAAFSSTASR